VNRCAGEFRNLNEFLKEHRKVAKQEATITELKSALTKQEAAIAQQRRDYEATLTELKRDMQAVVMHAREQDTKMQSVSERIEMTRPAPQTVVNSGNAVMALGR
jgi:uncharacterized coiled-coil protein SlyX